MESKLAVPPPRASLIPRPRLLKRLDDGRAHPLTLVSAPPVAMGHTGLGRIAYERHDLAATTELEQAGVLLEREGNLEGTCEFEE